MKNFATMQPKIWALVSDTLTKHDLQIYEINNFRDWENDVLQILVENKSQPNKSLDFDTLVLVNEELSQLLDGIAEIDEPYVLEVASAGIEKKIRSCQELVQALNQYVHLEFHQTDEQSMEIEGYLKKYDQQTQEFMVEYFVKGQPKKIKFNWEKIKTARYAVKF